MVTLYVGGKPVGTVADEDVLVKLLRAGHTVELRSDRGVVLGDVVPIPPVADEPLIRGTG